jgi:hypothetical protein
VVSDEIGGAKIERASARNFRFHSKFINHSDWYKIQCSRMGQRACQIIGSDFLSVSQNADFHESLQLN